MTIAEKVVELRGQIIAAGNEPVPDKYQGVTKDRVSEVLREIDRYNLDQHDAVFVLLDDVNASFYCLQLS